SGRHLIMAASILRSANPREFDRAFRQAITEKPGSYGETHAALLATQPRGIVTFNYDQAHEAAAKKDPTLSHFRRILPTDEGEIVRVLSQRFAEPFLLKAHGSLGVRHELVLTQESYREILAKSPAYRAFFQSLLTNFHFLVVGFGLD